MRLTASAPGRHSRIEIDRDTGGALTGYRHDTATHRLAFDFDADLPLALDAPRTARELPFAGHPTLGTAWVLGRDRDSYTLDLLAGRVRVTFEAGGIAWMQPPPVESGDALSPQSAAALLGLTPADIDNRYPCRFATVGPWFVLIGVKGLDALRRATVQTDVYDELAGEDVLGVFVFAGETYSDDAHFAARMFHHRGFREDPATGSANTALAGESAPESCSM